MGKAEQEPISIGNFMGDLILSKVKSPTNLSDEKRLYYATRPIEFAEEILGVDIWSKQEEILEAVLINKRVTVKSCHGAGKTFTAAIVVLWFLICYAPSTVVTTAPTARQVKSILWEEIRLRYKQAKIDLGGRLLQMELQMGPKWLATGFATDEYNVERFQGYHNENILVVVDEASGVARNIFTGIEGLLSSGNAHLLLIGNPTDELSEFGNSFKSSLYKKIHISAFDTPNLVEGKTIRPYLVTPEWVGERKTEWGETDPLYEVRVLGNFPTTSEGALIPLAWIERAKASTAKPEGITTMGVDIARFGGDESVAYLRQGDVVIAMWKWIGNDTMESTGKIARLIDDHTPSRVNIDAVGVGAGVYDRLIELGYDVYAINGSERAFQSDRFLNLRTEITWNLKTRFENGVIRIADDDRLEHQLVNLKQQSLSSRGQLRLENKEDMKARIGASPDRADALALAFWEQGRQRTALIGNAAEFAGQQSSPVPEHQMERVGKNLIMNTSPAQMVYNKLANVVMHECINCHATGHAVISWSNMSGNVLSPADATIGKCMICGYSWEIVHN